MKELLDEVGVEVEEDPDDGFGAPVDGAVGSTFSRISGRFSSFIYGEPDEVAEIHPEEKECEVTMEKYGLTPQYKDGEMVEFYSSHANSWVCGKISLQVVGNGLGDMRIMYDVTLFRSEQLRSDVKPDQIRPPFANKEAVEVFIQKKCEWIEAHVVGEHGAHGVLTGYTVKVHSESKGERTLKGVPAAKIRRRFQRGERVNVYRGIEEGYVTGEVDDQKASDTVTRPPPLTDKSPGAGAALQSIGGGALGESGEITRQITEASFRRLSYVEAAQEHEPPTSSAQKRH